MPIEYPIFDTEPDFTSAPTVRSMTKADMVNLSNAPELVTWSDTRTETVIALSFAWHTRQQAAAIKQFWCARGGKHEVFLLPTWEADYSLVGAPGLGATEIVVEGDYTAILVDTRPDTPGRYLFIRDPSGGLAKLRVISAVFSTDHSTLTVEPALPFGVSAGAMVGNMLLVRHDDDELTFKHSSPDTGMVDMAFRTVLERQFREQAYELTGEQVYQSLGFVESEQLYEERFPLRSDVSYATGPTNLHVIQSDPYPTRWAIWLGSTALRIGRADDDSITPPYDGFGQPSQLFPTGKPNTTHITLAFDQTSREIVAWQQADAEVVHLRRWNNGVIVEQTWPGKWPQLFFNGVIAKQARLDGETDVAAYYIKSGHNVLFMRMERDNFLTEYTGNPAPGKPLYLLKSTEISGFIHELTAVDSGFRMMRVRTDPYPQPVIVEPVSPFVPMVLDPETVAPVVVMGGAYFPVIRDGGVWPEVVGLPMTLLGAYTSEIISAPPIMETVGLPVLLSGSYDSTIAVVSLSGEQLNLSPVLSGSYTLAIIPVPAITETMGLAPLLAGSYDQTVFNPQTVNDTATPSILAFGTYGP